MSRTRTDHGFTLLELMVVVLVIAVLVAIAVPVFLSSRNRSNDAVARTSLRTARTAANAVASAGGSTAFADATALGIDEPRLTYLGPAVASTGPTTISVSAGSGTWAAAALSTTGTCFATVFSADGATLDGTITGGTCTADAAVAQLGASLPVNTTTSTSPTTTAPTTTTMAVGTISTLASTAFSSTAVWGRMAYGTVGGSPWVFSWMSDTAGGSGIYQLAADGSGTATRVIGGGSVTCAGLGSGPVPASTVLISGVTGIAVVGGEVWFGSDLNTGEGDCVRKATFASGSWTVSLAVGNGTEGPTTCPASSSTPGAALGYQIRNPGDITGDAAGNAWVTVRLIDNSNAQGCVIKVAPNGSFTTVQIGNTTNGTCSTSWTAPRGVAISPDAGTLYVGLRNPGCVKRVDVLASPPAWSAWSGGGATTACGAADGTSALTVAANSRLLGTDATGNLIMTDSNCVFRVASAGTITRLAGTGSAASASSPSAGDGGPALGAAVTPTGLAVTPNAILIGSAGVIRTVSTS